MQDPLEVSDEDFKKLSDLLRSLKNHLETQELRDLLKKLLPAIIHLRDYRSVTMKKDMDSHHLYKMALQGRDLFPADFDPIVGAWNRRELMRLHAESKGKQWNSPETYPKKGGAPPRSQVGGGMRPGGYLPGRSPVDRVLMKQRGPKRGR